MVQSLAVLYDGLMENDSDTIHQMLDEIDFQMEKTSNFMAGLGAISKSLEETDKRVELSKELNTKTLTEIEDVDIYRASSDFKRTETVLQSTLMASNKLLQPSLLNFLQ
jgi:flagellar hook-associated protein 3 FlgL